MIFYHVLRWCLKKGVQNVLEHFVQREPYISSAGVKAENTSFFFLSLQSLGIRTQFL